MATCIAVLTTARVVVVSFGFCFFFCVFVALPKYVDECVGSALLLVQFFFFCYVRSLFLSLSYFFVIFIAIVLLMTLIYLALVHREICMHICYASIHLFRSHTTKHAKAIPVTVLFMCYFFFFCSLQRLARRCKLHVNASWGANDRRSGCNSAQSKCKSCFYLHI